MGNKTFGEDNKIKRQQKDQIYLKKKLNLQISFICKQKISHFLKL